MLLQDKAGYVSGTSRARPVETSDHLPGDADVVVVGGGIVGCCAALELAARGVAVVLCEKGVVGGEASGRAAGLIEYGHFSPQKLDMTARAMTLWRELAQRTGEDFYYKANGLVSFLTSDHAVEAARNWIDSVKSHPLVQARILSAAQLKDLDPHFAGLGTAALYQPNGASVEPRLAAPAIAAAARRAGVHIVQNCAVRNIVQSGRQITGVDTERGAVRTPRVLIAGGLWSPALARMLGLVIPQMMIFAEQISVTPADGPAINGMTPAGYYRREPDGGWCFGAASGVVPIVPAILRHFKVLMKASGGMEQEITPAFNWNTFRLEARAARRRPADRPGTFEATRVFTPNFIGNAAQATFEGMKRDFPVFQSSTCKIRERYAGALMTTIDNRGVLGPVERLSGLYLCSDFLYGLSVAPALGEAIAQMICNQPAAFDWTPHRYERFEDGSQLLFEA